MCQSANIRTPHVYSTCKNKLHFQMAILIIHLRGSRAPKGQNLDSLRCRFAEDDNRNIPIILSQCMDNTLLNKFLV